jgi:hypothetical protein
MDISSSAAAVQTAVARTNATQSFIKNNADSQAAIADVVSQAAEQGAAAASGGRGSIVDISV